MPSTDDTEHFAGKPIKYFKIAEGIVDPASFAYCICYKEDRYDDFSYVPSYEERCQAFFNDPHASEVSALIISGDGENDIYFGESCEPLIASLVNAREQLPVLTSLWFGFDDWVNHDEEWLLSLPDATPIFRAFPQLEEIRLYGWTHVRNMEFKIGMIRSEVLRSFSLATAYLPPRILHQLWQADLPQLEHLELWLHDAGRMHGGSEPGKLFTLDDVAPLFSGKLFPRLRSLEICYSEMEDTLAVALATSPLLERLKVLELSQGILTDRGVQALLANPALRQLEKLVLNYHYCSAETVQQVRALPLEVEIDEPQQEDHIFGKRLWTRFNIS